MELTFRHLDRQWEVTIPQAPGEPRPVRFRHADGDDARTWEARVQSEELDDPDPAARELAIRRVLESALVLEALDGHADGLTAEEVASRTGMPPEAAMDRMDVLESVQPAGEGRLPVRYRRVYPRG